MRPSPIISRGPDTAWGQIYDGSEAVKVIPEERPDLILLDLLLPGADGWSVCRFVAASAELNPIPVIVHSARGSAEDVAQALGVSGFFPKPYMTADVLRHVERCSQWRQSARWFDEPAQKAPSSVAGLRTAAAPVLRVGSSGGSEVYGAGPVA